MSNGPKAVCIMIKERYFYGFGKKGQVLTAWHLAGAKVFDAEGWGLDNACSKIESKGHELKIVEIGPVEQKSDPSGARFNGIQWQDGKFWLRVFDTHQDCHLVNPDQIVEIKEGYDPDGRRRYSILLNTENFIVISRNTYKELVGVEPATVPQSMRVSSAAMISDEDIPF